MRAIIQISLLLAALVPAAHAYDILRGPESGRVVWPNGTVTMQIKVNDTQPLQDGTTFAGSVQAAMTNWNTVLQRVQFAGTIVSPSDAGDGNGINEITLSDKVYADDFEENVLAVTVSWRTGADGAGIYTRTQSDIIFNSDWTWDSYRGTLTGQPNEDVRRVAIHELGHALGLGHPDENDQVVTAIMNSQVSNVDALQTDDINGAQYLYGVPGDVRPANDNFANAISVPLVNALTRNGTSSGATAEVLEPQHVSGESPKASVWWKLQMAAGGLVTINSTGTFFDTMLGVYYGSGLGALTSVASNDDIVGGEIRTSSVTFHADSGVVYYIALDGWDGETGAYVLNFSYTQDVANVAPSITSHPANRSVTAGETAQFSVLAAGTPAPTLQWQRQLAGGSWENISAGGVFSGTTSATLTVTGATIDLNGASFRCVATNAAGSATSNPATLTVQPGQPPTLSGSPSVTVGANIRSVWAPSVSGVGPFSYQWYRNGVPIPNSNSSKFDVGAATADNLGEYFVVVTNASGSVVSNVITAELILSSSAPPAHHWIKAVEFEGVVYFLFSSPAQIRRFDLATGTWLSPWSLPFPPTDFGFASDAIYVLTGPNIVKYDRALANPTTLIVGFASPTGFVVAGDYIVTVTQEFPSNVRSYNRSTGADGAVTSVFSFHKGYYYNSVSGRIFGLRSGSPPDIISAVIGSNGTFGTSMDSPYHGNSSVGNRIIPMGNDRVADDSGTVYDGATLAYRGSFGGAVSDAVPDGIGGYFVLRDGRLSRTDAQYREVGFVARPIAGARMWRTGQNVYIFAQPTASNGVPNFLQVNESTISEPARPAAVSPVDMKFWHGEFFLDNAGILHAYNRQDRQILRWSSETGAFLDPVLLQTLPSSFSYSADHHKLYFRENGYQVRSLDLAAPGNSVPFATFPRAVDFLRPMGGFIFAGGEELNSTFSQTGATITVPGNGYRMSNGVWDAVRSRLYFIPTGLSPADLYYHSINGGGEIAGGGDSPFHGADGMTPPLTVSPDGELVVLSSGRMHAGSDLSLVRTLPNTFMDMAWAGTTLHTVRAVSGGAEIQTWSGAAYALQRSTTVSGQPLRILALPNGNVLVVTRSNGDVTFRVLRGSDLVVTRTVTPTLMTRQTITFTPANRSWGSAAFSLTATASSSLPVAFEIVSGPATISGNSITLTGVGTVTVRAFQGGNSTYAPTAVEKSFTALPPSGFSASAYAARYADLAAFGSNAVLAWQHYLDYGVYEGRSDGEFDLAAYLALYPEVGPDWSDAALHWYLVGRPAGRMIPAGFDPDSYLSRYPDVATVFAGDRFGAWLYYRDFGIYDGEVFDEEFRVEEYLGLNSDLAGVFGTNLSGALLHWLSTGRVEGRLGRIPVSFDGAAYLARNPDLAAAFNGNLSLAWSHYWQYGIYEGRAFDDEFRVFEYLAINPDMLALFEHDWRGATLHWLRYGRTEGRLGRVPLIFSSTGYLARYPEVETAWGNYPTTVWQHYWLFGVFEARNFDEEFRVDEYIALNPDLAAVFGGNRRTAFMHWVRYGRAEGRPGRSP
jgi:hypothetical protein